MILKISVIRMLIITQESILLQKFCEIKFYYEVTLKIVIGPDDILH